MTYEMAVTGVRVASWCALGVTVAAVIRAGAHAAAMASETPGPLAEQIESSVDDGVSRRCDDRFEDAFIFDDQTQSALAACMFGPSGVEHIWWTIMVVDPALHDTPSHIRLVGHYDTEFEAMDAADQLATELNRCLVPGEAPLTTKPLGIEPEVAITRTSDQVEHHPAAPGRHIRVTGSSSSRTVNVPIASNPTPA